MDVAEKPTTADGSPIKSGGVGPVDPVAAVVLKPLALGAVRLSGGLLGELQQRNGERSIPAGADHLDDQGAFDNFDAVAAGRTDLTYHGPCFEDGEAYKWLEAVAWEAARSDDPRHRQWLSERSARIAAAQAEDGYLNTFVQAGRRAQRYEQLAWDHEIFNNGALIQSAIAQYRVTGSTVLLEVARRAADHLDETFGPGRRAGACGHPLAELALVELFRSTEERRYLELARYFVDVRGQDLIDPDHGFGDAYHSDRIPVRDTEVPEGHAVRAIYLAAGATDVAIEIHDHELLRALIRQWEAMVEQKTYLTGGLGSRWEGEAFGDPYELPSDRAYAETCAAIAGIQWSWRLLLATGESRFADLIERQLYNAVLPGIGMDGDTYFYANALHLRDGAVASDTRMAAAGRQHWFGCSCCPTNLMRTLASLDHYVATTDGEGVQMHLYAAATITTQLDDTPIQLNVETDYPWSGEVMITVERTGDRPWPLSLRIPAWAENLDDPITVEVVGDRQPVSARGSQVILRSWSPGDVVRLRLPVRPRLVGGHHRVDATRGAVAIERGPLVYAFEAVDQADGIGVDDLVITSAELTETILDDLGGVPLVSVPARVRDPRDPTGQLGPEVAAHAVPYFRWANRTLGPMRVWTPYAA